jgi:hypothetical protein
VPALVMAISANAAAVAKPAILAIGLKQRYARSQVMDCHEVKRRCRQMKCLTLPPL